MRTTHQNQRPESGEKRTKREARRERSARRSAERPQRAEGRSGDRERPITLRLMPSELFEGKN